MLKVILGAIAKLVEIGAELAAGKISEDEARARCLDVGVSITETDSDAELHEHEELLS